MPLNGSQMGTEVWNAVKALGESDIKDGEKLWQTACEKIVEHITMNAIINTTGTAVGITPGPAAAPTTATGTIS